MAAETRIQSLILAQLPLRIPGCRVWRSATVKARAGQGWIQSLPLGHPDISGWLPHNGVGVALFIEVKSDRGRLSAEQEAFGEWARAGHTCHVVARSLDDVLEGIRNFREEHS